MIVAIVNQTSPSGQVKVNCFIDAADEAAALALFLTWPPVRTPANWMGYDTGWGSVQNPAVGFDWDYDFDTPGLVQVAQAEVLRWCGQIAFDGQDKIITTLGTWQTLYRFNMVPDFICEADRFVLRPVYSYRSTGGAPKLRITENNVLYGAEEDLSDEAGWTRTKFRAGGVAAAGENTYAIEGDGGVGSTLFEIRAMTVEILRKSN